MTRDFSILLPVCFLIVFLLLYRIFRRLLYVSVALAVNVVALVWTFGIMGMLNVTFTVVIGHSYYSVSYRSCRRNPYPQIVHTAQKSLRFYLKALRLAYRDQLKPCFLAAATIVCLVASFVFSEISPIRVFGIFLYSCNVSIPIQYYIDSSFISFEKSKKAVFLRQKMN